MAYTELIDHTGRTVFRGTQKPPGASPPVRALYSGFAGISINDGATANLPIDSLDDGTALLDLSTPAQPTFIAAGAYIVSTDQVAADAPPTAGGYYVMGLFASDALGNGLTSAQGTNTRPPLTFLPTLTVCVVAALPGAYLTLVTENHDGVAARNFSAFEMTVVKLA